MKFQMRMNPAAVLAKGTVLVGVGDAIEIAVAEVVGAVGSQVEDAGRVAAAVLIENGGVRSGEKEVLKLEQSAV